MESLKKQSIWFCWKYETRKGKRTKVPKSAHGTATGTTLSYAHTWVTFAEAKKAAKKQRYDGVGFKIPEDCFFLDIDHKDISDPYVQEILERFDSYAESSVSGGGIHIYGKCDIGRIPTYTDASGKLKLDKAFYQKNPHNDTELYMGGITNRFAVYTGNAICDKPLRDCTDALLETLDKNMRREESTPSGDEQLEALDHEKRDVDSEVFEVVCNLSRQKNSEKFSTLYYSGDTSDFGSPSEADCALCSMIAFRTGDDPDLIDAVYRSSALYREKWEREDYRTATIRKGIDACHGEFHRASKPAPEFIDYDDFGNLRVNVPLLAKHVRKNLRYILVRDNGKQGLLKYVYEGGCYRLYSNDMLMGVIKQYIAEYDETLVKMHQVSEALQHITTDLNYVSQDMLDSREDLINFQNGMLRVTDSSIHLTPHSPNIYSTIQIPCRWSGEPKPTPVFDNYLRTLANDDMDVGWLLLEFMGVCISNIKGWRLKKSLFLVGDGDTGKSQLKSLVERLLGKGNFIGIDLKEIEARFGTGAIYGTRLAGSSDMSFLSVEELKTFKKLTGGDSVYAEFKGQQAFEFTYNGLLWFCMNRLPKFGGDNGQWVYNRIMVVRCPNVIPKEQQDKQLLDKMYAEREGIVYKAVRALQTVIRNGYRFSEPSSIRMARDQYMEDNSSVISFFKECMCLWPDGKIHRHCTTGRVHRVYQAWCKDNNSGYARTAREFREELAAYLGSTYSEITTRQKGNTYYKDYGINLETKTQYAREYGYDNGDFSIAG